MIGRQGLNNPAVAQAQAIIERQATHLTRLVDDLLDVSRITLGSINLQTQLLDLNVLAAEAVELVQSEADTAGLRLGLTLSAAPALIQGDAIRLAQCLSNLLNNAIKFTPSGGGIALTVQIDPDEQRACLLVRDDGMGIASENLDRIFEVFVQTSISGSQGYSGLGIGLALTRKLITLHGGTVQAQSAGLGQGSVFEICLPALPSSVDAAADLALAHPPRPPPPFGPMAALLAPSSPLQAVNATSHAQAADEHPLVLVVDDNEDAANMLSEVITLSGFRSQSVYTGESALQAMADRMPAAVLLDIGLPDISGYEVCQRLRSWRGTQPLVIAVTGWGRAKDRAESMAVGFDAHLTKPTDPQLIVNMLEETLG